MLRARSLEMSFNGQASAINEAWELLSASSVGQPARCFAALHYCRRDVAAHGMARRLQVSKVGIARRCRRLGVALLMPSLNRSSNVMALGAWRPFPLAG